jgi:putative ABC transport system substrate-binding protein
VTNDRKKDMKKTITFLALCTILSALCSYAAAQQPAKIPRLGYLTGGDSSPNEAFAQGLRDIGYFEGKNIAIEVRNADGTMDRLPHLAAELVRLKVNVIVAVGGQATLPAKHATSTIPIVFTLVSDPVGAGLVTSLARPGGNLTGLSSVSTD